MPPLAFVVLVAVGADYNMLFVSRMRDESPHSLRYGIIRTLSSTGGVITAAGLIFAASMVGLLFSSIGIVVQGGFVIGVGILLDTFVVRTITVPAIAALVGRANWWPSRLDAGRSVIATSQARHGRNRRAAGLARVRDVCETTKRSRAVRSGDGGVRAGRGGRLALPMPPAHIGIPEDTLNQLAPTSESSILSMLHGRASLRPDDVAFTFTDYGHDPAGVRREPHVVAAVPPDNERGTRAQPSWVGR